MLQPQNTETKTKTLNIIENNDAQTTKQLVKALLKPAIDCTPIVSDKKKLADTIRSVNKLYKLALFEFVKVIHSTMIK